MRQSLSDRPVFICGHPKSGTSLLRSLLDSHPELLVYPEETVFFRRYLPKASGKSLEEKLVLADELLLHIFSWNQIAPPPSQANFPDRDYADIPFHKVREAYRKLASYSVRHDGDLLFYALAAYGEVSGYLSEETHRWVEKTPYNERFVRQILEWWPVALFIHVIRDPRDNYATYKRKHPDWDVESFAKSWQESALQGLQLNHELGGDRYWVMRYEDFILKPEEYIGKLCNFLGIQDHPTLRTPTRNGRDWGGNSMFGERFQGIDKSPIGRWKDNLSALDVVLTEAIASQAMQLLGYTASGLAVKDIKPGDLPRYLKYWLKIRLQ